MCLFLDFFFLGLSTSENSFRFLVINAEDLTQFVLPSHYLIVTSLKHMLPTES